MDNKEEVKEVQTEENLCWICKKNEVEFRPEACE